MSKSPLSPCAIGLLVVWVPVTRLALKGLNLMSSKRNVSDVIGYIFQCITDYIESDSCPCRVALDWASSEQLTALIKSLLSTKPVCGLNNNEQGHISSLLLKVMPTVNMYI